MEIPNIYDMPFNPVAVRTRTQIYKYVLFIEACLDVGCAVFFWTYLGASYTITDLYLPVNYDLLVLIYVTAGVFTCSFVLSAIRYGGVQCRFLPTIVSAFQFFIYLGLGAVLTAITVKAMQIKTEFAYLSGFAAYAYLLAIIQILDIFLPPYTDRTCLQLCCHMYDNQIKPELLEPQTATYPDVYQPQTNMPLNAQKSVYQSRQQQSTTSPTKKIIYAQNQQPVQMKQQKQNTFRTVDETYDSINVDLK